MDRRSYLKKFFVPKSESSSETMMAPLDEYSGEWTSMQAAHLLRRATYASNRDTIQEVVDNGMAFTIDQLFATKDMPDPPVNYRSEDDPNVPIGSTWIGQVYSSSFNAGRNRSMRAWALNLILDEGIHIREKMTLFWHNHLVAANLNDARFKHMYITTLRRNAMGNFKTLMEEITIDPSMLRYLNGKDNKVGSPNENYARELLELFTIGKGDLAGPGDYTFYTETDVEELAKALTGWRMYGHNKTDIAVPYSEYQDNRHDKSTKTLSHRFGNAVIENNGAEEYKDVINIIFQQEAVSKFICRKLYRYFVQETISPSTEVQVIEPLAEIMRLNSYEIEPVLRKLLASEHFYEVNCIGTMIKNPIEHIASFINGLQLDIPDDVVTKYGLSLIFHTRARNMEMEYFEPPNVAGWKAYYQEPSFYRLWISSVTLPQRIDFTDDLTLRRINTNGFQLSVDALAYVDNLPTDISLDVNLLLADLVSTFFCKPLDELQITGLKEILIPGLPDMEWEMEYSAYLDPATTSDDLKTAISRQLTSLFRAMFAMPEFFLS